MSLSQCDVISNTDWWPLMTPDLSFGHLSATGSPFLLMTNTLAALRSLHESTVWMAISQILDDHVRWLKIQRPSNGKWMDMIWLDQCAVESQCMYKAKTVEIHLNAPYYIPGYPRYVYIVGTSSSSSTKFNILWGETGIWATLKEKPGNHCDPAIPANLRSILRSLAIWDLP